MDWDNVVDNVTLKVFTYFCNKNHLISLHLGAGGSQGGLQGEVGTKRPDYPLAPAHIHQEELVF